MIWNLSEAGRSLKLSEWKAMGGGGFSHQAKNRVGLHFQECQAQWEARDPTLGELSSIDPYIGRSTARFAIVHLDREDLAVPDPEFT